MPDFGIPEAYVWNSAQNFGTNLQVNASHVTGSLCRANPMPWFIKTQNGERGPLPSAKLKELVEAGKLNERVLIRRDSQTDWIQAGSVEGLFHRSTPPAVTPQVVQTVKSLANTVSGWTETVANMIPQGHTSPTVPDVPIVVRDYVDPILAKLTADEQPSAVVEKIVPRVRELLTANEELLYIAVQSKPIVNLMPDCVVLTNRRFMIVRPKMLGRMSFRDYIWRELRNVQVRDDLIGATIYFESTNGDAMTLDYIPKAQAKAIYRFAQQREEEVLEERRNRKMEETRAGASQMVIQTAVQPTAAAVPAAPTQSPLERMQHLKQFLDAGLISQAEFDAKKSEIMKSL